MIITSVVWLVVDIVVVALTVCWWFGGLMVGVRSCLLLCVFCGLGMDIVGGG